MQALKITIFGIIAVSLDVGIVQIECVCHPDFNTCTIMHHISFWT